MTTNKKLVIAVVALSLALACAIGSTLAFLIAESDTVTNTFTYGGIEITLAETKGTENGATREFGTVVPGATIDKDPTVTVIADSENCYVYAKVVNNVVLKGEVVVTCNINNGWTLIGKTVNADGSVVSLYKYDEVVTKATTDTELTELFNNVTFATSIESGDIETLEAITNDIVITAYAHQSDNTTENVANAAAITWAGVTAVSANN